MHFRRSSSKKGQGWKFWIDNTTCSVSSGKCSWASLGVLAAVRSRELDLRGPLLQLLLPLPSPYTIDSGTSEFPWHSSSPWSFKHLNQKWTCCQRMHQRLCLTGIQPLQLVAPGQEGIQWVEALDGSAATEQVHDPHRLRWNPFLQSLPSPTGEIWDYSLISGVPISSCQYFWSWDYTSSSFWRIQPVIAKLLCCGHLTARQAFTQGLWC